MNSQGYTKDNIHKGNTKIVAGGIDVDGLIRVGDQSVGGDGYVLPAVKGTEGQVLAMNADNSTSFQDASGGGTETRIGSGNNETVAAAGGTLNQGFLPSFSGVRLTDIKNIPPGSSYVLEAQSLVEIVYDGSSPSVISNLKTNLSFTLGGTSSNTATITNTANLNVYPSPSVIGTTYRSNWFYKAVVTRSVLGNGFWINAFSTMNRFGNTNYLVNMATTPTGGIFLTIDGDPNDTTIDFIFQFDNALGSGTTVQYTTPDIHWYISQLGEVNAPTLSTNDHTQLTNLNAGDGGHTNMFLTNGLKPMNGNINMNANDLNNVKDINGRGGLNLLQVQNTNGLFYLDGAEIRMTADTSINLYPTNNLRLGNGGQDISINPTTKTDHFGELDMIGNPITNCTSINGLTPVGGLFSGTSDSLNVAATTAEISILPLTFVGVGFGVSPNGFSVGDCFLLNLSGPFNSNNNDTLTIRLKGGPTSTTLLSTLVVPLNASSASVFQLTVFFQIRNIGGAGVADIVSDADLTYNQSGAGGSFVGEQSLSQNNTTFDSTVANILDVTAQFSSTSANNDMTTRVSKLQKTF